LRFCPSARYSRNGLYYARGYRNCKKLLAEVDERVLFFVEGVVELIGYQGEDWHPDEGR
jgi:hypothetical protein